MTIYKSMTTQSYRPEQAENPGSDPQGSLIPALNAGGGSLAAITSNAAATSVLASIWVAKQFPRNIVEVTSRMNQACSRLTLAQAATYAYPRGGTSVEGPSIRLAEALIGAWGNAEAGWKEVSRYWDAQGADGNGCNVSECVAFCFDKETNVRREISFTVPHTRDKGEVDSRGKKTGKMLRIPLDSERDIYELCANMASRRIRACILQVLPGWLVEEALEVVAKTIKEGDTRPLADIARSMEAKFMELGVSRDQLVANLGHSLEEITRQEVIKLGKTYNSIKEGMVYVKDVFPPMNKKPDIPDEPLDPMKTDDIPFVHVSTTPAPAPTASTSPVEQPQTLF